MQWGTGIWINFSVWTYTHTYTISMQWNLSIQTAQGTHKNVVFIDRWIRVRIARLGPWKGGLYTQVVFRTGSAVSSQYSCIYLQNCSVRISPHSSEQTTFGLLPRRWHTAVLPPVVTSVCVCGEMFPSILHCMCVPWSTMIWSHGWPRQ